MGVYDRIALSQFNKLYNNITKKKKNDHEVTDDMTKRYALSVERLLKFQEVNSTVLSQHGLLRIFQ